VSNVTPTERLERECLCLRSVPGTIPQLAALMKCSKSQVQYVIKLLLAEGALYRKGTVYYATPSEQRD
jgi:hypothetical protein